MTPKLSIITTVYNCGQFLEESIQSVLDQTFTDYEWIFVNDGSKDNTRDILLKYFKLPNIRILENKYNEGIAVSRNRGLLAAKGEYVAIHDGDDISLSLRFEDQYKYLDKNPLVGFLGSHAIKIGQSGEHTGFMSYPPLNTTQGFAYVLRYKLNPIIDSSSMYRRKLVIKYGGYSMIYRYSSDFGLWCRLMANGVELSNLQYPLIKYRTHDKNVTKTAHVEMRRETDDIVAKLRRRSFPSVQLRSSYFKQDSFTEILNEVKEN